MRVLAFTPTWDAAMAPEMRTSMEQQRYDGQLDWVVSTHNPFPAPDHRNVLAQYRRGRERCLADGYDALLTVEHDMVLPDNAVQELADTPGDVVYGVYLFRWGAFVLNAFEYVGQRNIGESLSLHPRKAQAAMRAGTVRVSGCGWGCTLLRRRALERIEFPETYPENPAYDIRFAQLAVRAGLEMYANFRVLCGHKYRDMVMWPDLDDPHVVYSGHMMRVGGAALPMCRDSRLRDVDVVVTKTVNALTGGKSVRLTAGQSCVLPYGDAYELARAGYLEILP